jgi:serine/threonine protein kinase
MATSIRLDLRPFGINYTLTPKSDLRELDLSKIAGFITRLGPGLRDVFIIDGEPFVKDKQLGAGTYGVTYKAEHKGRHYAVKCVRLDREDWVKGLWYFMCEAIIQILLYEAGPYVPRVYKIAYDPKKKVACMVSQLMRNTLKHLISAFPPSENDKILPDALTQIAHALDVYGRKLQFNHRDLHTSNIMYERHDDKRYFKLIDFGFSCVNWHGLEIKGSDYFETGPCYKPDRNLAQALYYIVTSKTIDDHISKRLQHHLRQFLIARVRNDTLNMVKGSRARKMTSWKNTYNFLHRTNVKVPAATPDIVEKEMARFLNGQPFEGYVEPSPLPSLPKSNKTYKACPPGKILNPATGRCVNIDGRIGRGITRKNGKN